MSGIDVDIDDEYRELNPDKAIKKAIDKVFSEMSGVVSDEEGINKAIDFVGGLIDVNSVLRCAVSLSYKKQKQLRSIEKYSASQDSLFPNDLMEKIVSYTSDDGQASSVKYSDCKYAHHEFNREQQIRGIRRQNKSFERSEERREVIMPILKKDDGMVTKDAIAKLDDKSRRRKAG